MGLVNIWPFTFSIKSHRMLKHRDRRFPRFVVRKLNSCGEKFLSHYKFGGKLGSGGFGDVYAAVRKSDQLPVAIKFIKKRDIHSWGKIKEMEIPLECLVLRQLSHIDGVIGLIEYCDAGPEFLIVMERMVPSETLDQIVLSGGPLSESVARCYFRQIVDVVVQCHCAGIIHRDLKETNIVVNLDSQSVKLIDFGLATYNKSLAFHGFVGTPGYCPPEMVEHKCYFGDQAAVWSLGVVLYTMVYATAPEWERRDINNGSRIALVSPFDVTASRNCRDLIHRLLSIRPDKRIRLERILFHPWMTGV